MPPPAPSIANPYPNDYDGQAVEDFTYLTPLILRREVDAPRMRGGREDADYIVGAPYEVSFRLRGEQQVRKIAVPKGMLTDLVSVPKFVRSIVSKVGPHLEASIVHDFLYLAWQDLPGRGARRADWDFADEILRAGMVAAKVKRDQVATIHGAVRALGWPIYKGKNPPPRYVLVP